MKIKKFLAVIALAGVLPLMTACPPPPPNLSPVAAQDFKATELIKALDVLRDIAISANATTPPLISTANTRAIVMYHESALKTIQASQSGWPVAVSTGLDQVLANLSPKEAAIVAPYVTLVKTAITAIVGAP